MIPYPPKREDFSLPISLQRSLNRTGSVFTIFRISCWLLFPESSLRCYFCSRSITIRLAPRPPEVENRDLAGLLGLGRNLLPILVGYGGSVETFAEPSPEKNPGNLRRYFFSRKLSAAEVKENLVHAEPLMPSLIGLSLRKGLQQINRYNINVRIQGSGRIVGQIPAAGEPLTETEICELILEKEHDEHD